MPDIAAELDPFHTAGLRAAVLAAWASSPTRFREDANVEEDLRLDGYADAWFVELAQNAADAARTIGGPGRVRVELVERELRVANTGAPLDAAGVAALASLRASAKRDDTGSVGRFGVGFTAVLALSDAPQVLGTGGGVAFSAARTATEAAALAGPAAELARRDEPPVLRLVWPTGEAPTVGFDTEVRLPLRAGIDAAAVLAGARDLAPDLLLVLPELIEIDVAGTVFRRADGPRPGEVTIGGRRWRLARRTGSLADSDARQQATEQRARRDWSVCWALPLTADGEPDPLDQDVLHAPTATGERLGLPARLIASVPVEPDRRRIRSGPATDRVLAGAARTYLDLVRATPPEQRIALVPVPGFPRSELDGRLRELLLEVLRGAAWLPGVDVGGEPAPGAAERPPGGGGGERAGRRVGVRSRGADAESGVGERAGGTGVRRVGSRPRRVAGPARRGAGIACAALPRRVRSAARAAAGPVRAGWTGVGAARPGTGRARCAPVDRRRARVPIARRRPAAELVAGALRRAGAGRRDGAGPARRAARLAGPAGRRPSRRRSGNGAAARRVCRHRDRRCQGCCHRAGRDFGSADTRLVGSASVRDEAAGSGTSGVGGPAAAAVAGLAALALPGLHIADADAVHPLLTRLGAGSTDPAALLEHPALAAAIERSVDDADAGLDPAPLADAVLALVAESGASAAGLGALALPDIDGYPSRADELMLPDAALRPLLAADTPIGVLDPTWARRHSRSVWTAIGVLDGFALVVDEDPVGPDHDLDDEDRWWDALDTPPRRLVAVRDLDLVDDQAWPAALALLASERETRAAVTAAGSYTAWWLGRHARLSGHRPTHYRLPSAGRLGRLYDPIPVESVAFDEAFLAAIGVRGDLTVRDVGAAVDLLDRLADRARTPDLALVAEAHAALAAAVAAGRVDAEDLELPEEVRALDGSVVSVDLAMVLDAAVARGRAARRRAGDRR